MKPGLLIQIKLVPISNAFAAFNCLGNYSTGHISGIPFSF